MLSHQNYDVVESNGSDQDVMFDHLSLLSDMRVEYEQTNLMNAVLLNSPDKPTGIDVVRLYKDIILIKLPCSF